MASKVELRISLDAIVGLEGEAPARLRRLAGRRLDAASQLVITSQRTRDQKRNLEDARERVRVLIRAALKRPAKRKPTRPSRAAKERRLVSKKQRSERKAGRRRSLGD